MAFKSFNKPKTQATTAAAPTQKKERIKKSPESYLQFRPKDSEELQLVCGLFNEISKAKKTPYKTGCNTEEKVRFYVFTQKDGGSVLQAHDYSQGEDKKLEEVCKLTERVSKKGDKFLVGENNEGSYFIFAAKPKGTPTAG